MAIAARRNDSILSTSGRSCGCGGLSGAGRATGYHSPGFRVGGTGWPCGLACGLIGGLARVGAHAAVAHPDGPAGPACFAGQQGADLRVGDRKVCGSAQVWRGDAVLQHGSILLHRLSYDETDVLVAAGGRDALRAATVTLEELGVEFEARRVAEALITGFTDALGCTFDSLPALRSPPQH